MKPDSFDVYVHDPVELTLAPALGVNPQPKPSSVLLNRIE